MSHRFLIVFNGLCPSRDKNTGVFSGDRSIWGFRRGLGADTRISWPPSTFGLRAAVVWIEWILAAWKSLDLLQLSTILAVPLGSNLRLPFSAMETSKQLLPSPAGYGAGSM